MATFLYKLGRFSFRRRRLVALLWVALLAAVGIGAASANTTGDNSFSIPGTEAQKAFDLLDERFPALSADGAQASIVFRAPGGEKITAADNKATVEAAVAELGDGNKQIARVIDPFKSNAVSRDGSTAYVSVGYNVQFNEMSDTSKDTLDKVLHEGRDAGLTVEAGGTAMAEIPETGSAEIVGIALAALVLVITFGSLVAAGLPLLTAVVGVGVGVASIMALTEVFDLSSTTPTLASMIGLAVGIDYALFVVSRYRAELAEGRDREEAAGLAVGTAGSAVVFAGLTVVIALAGLTVVNIPSLTKMGLAAAGTVAIAVIIALTLIPALLGFAGKRVLGRKARNAHKASKGTQRAAASSDKPNMGTRWAHFVLRRPVAVLITAAVALGVVAVPVASLKMGLPGDGDQPTSTTQRKAYDMLAESFGPGVNGPLLVTVDAAADGGDVKTEAASVSKTVTGLKHVAAVTPATYDQSGRTAILTVIPTTGPDSTKTEDLLADIRDHTDANVMVTGMTAMKVDVSEKLNDALAPYLGLVVGLAFLLLILVFRSILVPLKAALGFLLSVLASLGAVVAVFQWGWAADLIGVEQTSPIMSMMPIFMIGVVFGLAMDYEVFLVTRMREAHVHGESPRQAIVTGFQHGTRVVTAAAVIMICVFAGFIGSNEAMVKMIGFGLAIAVFFDAFIVRMTIVPAVLALLGDKAWWLPKWLDKALPNVDVEGEGLTRHIADTPQDPEAQRELIRV
ncbi:MMPL family transporter [Streptomyces ipomoeae]|uniref:MMPL family transporter n=1 Tax=Streptomyces ipomoeae TaxID=103232 RepID=UPI001146DDBE|nr:MMPL family transporter [Streptomyces ipomoeae]MDX2933459.1 MMPL family transporter [Streptomyces ipomoeae]TQE20274.1 MMPL family transporter [Streptomyces ipomoeae]